MSVPLILTLLAGAATFIGAFLGVLGQNPLIAFWPSRWVSPPGSCCLSR